MTTPTPDDAARRQARAELVPQILAAELRAASGGEITHDQARTLVAPLDPAAFLTAAGEVDQAAIAAYVQPVAGGNPATQGLQALQPGQGGQQQGTQPPRGAEAGLAEARRRWPEKYAEQQPAAGAQQPGPNANSDQWPDTGQGQRDTLRPPGWHSRDAGLEEARRRFGDQTQPA